MLTIEAPFYRLRDFTIFRDHEDPDLFYFLPPLPRIVRHDDELALTLYKYRRDLTDNPDLDPTRATGAGLALFEVEMPMPSSRQILLQSDLSSLTGREDAKLVPALFRTGKVSALTATSKDNKLVEDLAETRNAPLTAPYHSSFALALTAEGASLFEQAAENGQIPVGVVYELRFLALTPSLHARVTMDYERIYDHFSASIGFTYYVSVKLDLELTWLIENEFVKIEITAFTDGADRERQEKMVMSLVKARIQNDFFRSGIPPKPGTGMSGPLSEMLGDALGEGVSSASALFVIKAKYEAVREQKHHEIIFNGRTAVEFTHVSSGFLSTMIDEEQRVKVIPLDLDDPFFSRLLVEIDSVIDFDEMPDLNDAVVHVSHAGHRQSYSFKPDSVGPYTFQVALNDPKNDEYEYEIEFHIKNVSEPFRVAPARSRKRVLVINPLAHFGYRRLRIIAAFDPVLVPSMHVHLRIPGEEGEPDLAKAQLILDEQRKELVWSQVLPTQAVETPIRVRVDWFDQGGQIHQGDEHKITSDSFIAHGPFEDTLLINIMPVINWEKINQVLVELRYEDGDYRVERMAVIKQDNGNASQEILIPLQDKDKRQYQWREVIVRKDGTTRESEWEEVDKSVLVVGKEEVTDAELRVIWVGSPGNSLGMRADIWATNASGEEVNISTFIRAGEMQQSIMVPLSADGQLKYRFEIKRYSATGEELIRSGEGESNLLVIQASG